jgi:hypothetical protein
MLTTLLALLTALLFPRTVSAQVVINEFSAKTDPEWVEVYNTSTESADLDGWEIADGNTKSTDDLTISGTIPPDSFLVFEHKKGWLNDGGDTINLYDNTTPSGQLVDSFTYNQANEDTTTSRVPDGYGGFIYDTDPTKGEANQIPPTPTPTSSPTSTPTSTPVSSTPTSTPTEKPLSTPTPTSISILDLALSPTSASTASITNSSKIATKSSLYSVFFQESTVSGSILGENSSTSSGLPTVGHRFIFIGCGITLLSISILLLRYRQSNKVK